MQRSTSRAIFHLGEAERGREGEERGEREEGEELAVVMACSERWSGVAACADGEWAHDGAP